MTDTAVAQRRGPKRDIPMLDSQRKNSPYPKMELEVQDFGPIAKGKIDLRPLTVFVGPSNTGKSWMAMLVYSMASALSSKSSTETLANAGLLLWEDALKKIFVKSPPAHYPEDTNAWYTALVSEGKVTLTGEEAKLACRAAELSKSGFLGEMVRCFGFENPKQLIRWNADGNANISVNFGSIRYSMEIGESLDSTSLKAKIEKNPTLDFSGGSTAMDFGERGRYLNQLRYGMQGFQTHDDSRMLTDAIHCVSATLGLLHCNRKYEHAFYIPAARGGIVQTFDTILEGLADSADRDGPEGSSTRPMMTGIVGDFQKGIVRAMRESGKNVDWAPGLVSGLEVNVLRGTVDVEQRAVGHPRVYYQPAGSDTRLPMINTSAMISDMVPVALYLKYLVRAGDLLVLEEPEMNMHPEQQRLFIKEVVRWVNSGVRVVITTHSDFVLDELSNTVARSKLDEICPGKHEGTKLDDRSIGVWQIENFEEKQRDSGITMRNIEWNPDFGGYDAGFIEVSETLNNDWAGAMNRIGWTEDD